MHKQPTKGVEFQKVISFDVSPPVHTAPEPIATQASTSSNHPRRSQRVLHPLERFVPGLDFVLLTDSGEPSCYKEAMLANDKVQWEHAMKRELSSIAKNKTWELVPLPKGRKALPCKWVYKKKIASDVENYKARLVAKGFKQEYGVDFQEIFSPVVKMTTLRMLLALVATDNMELEQMDVITAFLHGDLEEEIYMQQPEGFVQKDKEHLVFLIILILYVDDILIAGHSKKDIADLKIKLKSKFDMKDLGEANHILGMRITRDCKKRLLYLSQKEYVHKVFDRFNMQKGQAVMELAFSLSWSGKE
ncbi:hypothetical protein L7F22_027753 [Adiantum nelumboides]|nr:hypothetical protein [Adiantum nelumboides]